MSQKGVETEQELWLELAMRMVANWMKTSAGTPQMKKSNVLSLTAFAKFIFGKSNCMCKCRALQNHLKLAVPSETLELLRRLWFAALQAEFLKRHCEKTAALRAEVFAITARIF